MALTTTRSEAVVQRCSVKKMFLEISQNSQENTCARVSFKKDTSAQVFPCEFCAISGNTFFHRTPLVTASVRFFSVQARTEMVDKWWGERLYCHMHFPQNNHFLH